MASFKGNIYIQVRYNIQTAKGVYANSHYFSAEDFEKMTDEEVEAKGQEFADAWVQRVIDSENAPRQEPTAEELVAQKEFLQKEVQEIDKKLEVKSIPINK